ncbi:hypothetical protein [Blastococcus saxobsidens]|nr:hypothetical protein [Blastococcus saxobsidens]
MDSVEDAEPGRRPLLCPFHPERLLCNNPECVSGHRQADHRDDELFGSTCFVCSVPGGA